MPEANHFELDPGIFHSVSVSGGLTSAYLARHIQLANPGNPNIRYVFANTGLEHELTYEFLTDITVHWKLPLTALEYITMPPGYIAFEPHSFYCLSRRGEPFEAMTKKERFYPSANVRLCTSRLKVRVIQGYIKDHIPEDLPKHYREVIGFRADEARRTRADGLYPLIDAGITKQTILAWWDKQPFQLRLPQAGKNRDTLLGNCQLCFLKGRRKLLDELEVLQRTGNTWVIDFWQRLEAGKSVRMKIQADILRGGGYKQLLSQIEAEKKQGKLDFDDPEEKYDTSCPYCKDD